LAQDDSPEWLSWQHAISTMKDPNGRKLAVFVSVPPTAPLRLASDIDGCVDTLLDSDADIVLTVAESDRNPYFNMVELDDDGYARLVKGPPSGISRRQSAPLVFGISTVAYAACPEFILRANSIFEGRVRIWQVPRERAVDIDTELDLAFAEFLMMRSIAVPPEG
jgi:N-acylneuraminate cytidylyltransferase